MHFHFYKSLNLLVIIWLVLVSQSVRADIRVDYGIENSLYSIDFTASGDIAALWIGPQGGDSGKSCKKILRTLFSHKISYIASLATLRDIHYTREVAEHTDKYKVTYIGVLSQGQIIRKSYTASKHKALIDINISLQGPDVRGIAIDYPLEFNPGNGGLTGLAASYGKANYIILENGAQYLLNEVADNQDSAYINLDQGAWFGIKDRFYYMLMSTKDHDVKILPPVREGAGNKKASIAADAKQLNYQLSFGIITSASKLVATDNFEAMKYASLWWPFKIISQGLATLFNVLHNIVGSRGLSIILLALLMRVLMTPITKYTDRLNADSMRKQELIAPELAQLKQKYKGEALHNKILMLHKTNGISALDPIKPLLGLFVQIPVFIAVFNMLGEASVLDGVGFLWVENLALSDKFFVLARPLPFIGHDLNILPVIMLLISIVSAKYYAANIQDSRLRKGQVMKLYSMGVLFFVLLYSFPAAMVLYWASVNAIQLIIQYAERTWSHKNNPISS